ncbi:uncharacterized protein LOC105695381 [Orussus abietinus]|uniref:uncharacterized protein LOC105695381 n=1 Tax=Orussus abietinus TaxID=222816 RepID=UPI000626DE67|nr:uncharacterized protein LOC105695381 [Orussus abietinus]
MDMSCQNTELDPKYLLEQLKTARKEINNLRQQIKSLRYIHEKDVDNIKRLLGLCADGVSVSANVSASAVQPSTSSDTNDILKLKPIGLISTWFPSKRGTPRQPTICYKTPGKLTLFNSILTNPEHALEGLQDFSHIWILFHFHRNDSNRVCAKVTPPRLNGVRTGVFSTRSPHRPCPIGLSLVKIIKIENYTIHFEGVDMVDQTPVLDIKPYIPQYDNPAGIEEFNNRLPKFELKNGDISEAIGQRLGEGAELGLNTNRRVNSCDGPYDNVEQPRDPLEVTIYANGSNEASQTTDISRDEEIALRLQTEEFEGSPTFDTYDGSRNYYHTSELTYDNGAIFDDDGEMRSTRRSSESYERSNIPNMNFGAPNRRNILTSDNVIENLRQDPQLLVTDSRNVMRNNRNSDPQVDRVRGMGNSLQALNLGSRENNESSRIVDADVQHAEDGTSRNSRLLDGADGPNTVCGTDLDLIQRRVLSSRLDNSPVRMGIREAPDGEEGLASQTLTPSQTVPNIRSMATTLDGNSSGSPTADINVGSELRSSQNPRDFGSFDVRVPDWISRPQVATLSVIFNDRALLQLNEILDDKADEQKRAIENVLREDPRSVYLRQRWGNQFYTFLIHDLHISCRFDDNRGIVTVFQIRHAGRTCECGEPEWQCLGHSPLS